MIDADIHTQTERYGAVELQWTNRIDAAGSRIDWQIATDTQGWVSRYGPVYNEGLLFGSRATSSQAEEQSLLMELRTRAQLLTGAQGDHGVRQRAA